jgi:hypothetical protein
MIGGSIWAYPRRSSSAMFRHRLPLSLTHRAMFSAQWEAVPGNNGFCTLGAIHTVRPKFTTGCNHCARADFMCRGPRACEQEATHSGGSAGGFLAAPILQYLREFDGLPNTLSAKLGHFVVAIPEKSIHIREKETR